jgi:dihydrofolate reductase
MRKIILAMQMTLDGFSTGPNGEMDWLPPFDSEEAWKDLHQEMWNQIDNADAMLLGRVTYQIWETYWPAAASNPNSNENDRKFSRYAEETQKIVFSNTLDKVTWKNTRLIKDNIAEEVMKLKQLPGKNMYLVGGATLAQTFTKLGLIDEYNIIVHPVILGNGKPLLRDVNVRRNLKLLNTKTYNSGAVGLSYQSVKV